ncbi:hypothetical protein FisN_17Lh302 [Fistulifera solaris]|uniref:Uncharacterized protein n=1 Tax=Fistulifera solaris TaxID=1519565 RepID=A0A1Z5J5P5_FISSO|nr:hypothetical protein FisN_17Lh302 [Fistulifera solaris]|eukprot:GAX09232.1 hypothetical protein FisN_17Lh302 [Fistulifera solaris]
MASLLSEPWMEERVVSALLYHKQKKPQDRSSQVVQVISIRPNSNVVTLSDQKFFVDAFYDELNGTLRTGSLVSVKQWNIVASGQSGVAREKNAICFHVGTLDVIGGHGMAIIGKPSSINDSVEVKRVLDSWKFASTWELLRHQKPPSGDVAKVLQDSTHHHRLLKQYITQSRQTDKMISSQPTEAFAVDSAVIEQDQVEPQPRSPVTRKRLFSEHRIPGKENSTQHPSPHLNSKTNSLRGDELVEEMDDDSVENDKKMSIRNMLVMEEDHINEKKKKNDTVRLSARKYRNNILQSTGNEENNRNASNRFLSLWMELTQTPDDVV